MGCTPRPAFRAAHAPSSHAPSPTPHGPRTSLHEPRDTHRAPGAARQAPYTRHRAPDAVRDLSRFSPPLAGARRFVGGPRDRQPEAGRRRRAAQASGAGERRRRATRRAAQAVGAGSRRRQSAQAGDWTQTGTRDARSPVEGGGAAQHPTCLPRPKKDEGHSVTATSRELVRMPERRGGGDADRGPEAAKRRAPLARGHAAGHSNQSVLTTLERSRS